MEKNASTECLSGKTFKIMHQLCIFMALFVRGGLAGNFNCFAEPGVGFRQDVFTVGYFQMPIHE